jgi:hypothetical protein
MEFREAIKRKRLSVHSQDNYMQGVEYFLAFLYNNETSLDKVDEEVFKKFVASRRRMRNKISTAVHYAESIGYFLRFLEKKYRISITRDFLNRSVVRSIYRRPRATIKKVKYSLGPIKFSTPVNIQALKTRHSLHHPRG